jgi:MFS transporter, PPP family, 3-phenylpropionic acid transporter
LSLTDPAFRREEIISPQRVMLLQLALLYGALYLSFGVQSPYLPVLLESRGLGAESIGLVLAINTAVRVFAGPAAGRVADRLGARRAVLALCALSSAALAPLYLSASSFWTVLAVAVMQAAALAPLAPLSDALALATAAPQTRRGFTYGHVRGIGSAAFILGALLSGRVVSSSGIGAIVWLSALPLAGSALAAANAPLLSREDVLMPQPVAPRGISAVLRLASFRRVVVVAALILGSHAMHDAFAVIRWQEAGITPDMAGVLWSEQVGMEVLVFLVVGPWLLDRLGVARSVVLAAGTGVLRWSVMAISAWPPAMMLIEPLHGITFALLHLACMRLLAEIVPAALSATALTIYGTLGIGIATAVVTLASGPLYAHFGARGFWVMGALCAAALPMALRLREPRIENSMRPTGRSRE